MASIFQRKNQNGTKVWRAVIRIKGHPSVSNRFDRKQEAQDWAQEVGLKIKLGKYSFAKSAQEKTVADLIECYIHDGALEHHKAARDTKRHLEHFKNTLGKYALAYITPDLLIAERKKMLVRPGANKKLRNPATVNRYFASLGGAFRYASKNLRWLDQNPCAHLFKLKENPKKRRILTVDEEFKLLQACKQSKNRYLYCIVLIALTTGARKGEILALTWDCIDFDNSLAYIKNSKNGCPRKVGLVGSVLQELNTIRSVCDPQKSLVFASKTSFGKLDIKKPWQNVLETAGIKNFVFHGLRHHFCSKGGELGASGIQLRTQLGHSSSQMTDHYSHLDAEATRFIGESIEQRIMNQQGTL